MSEKAQGRRRARRKFVEYFNITPARFSFERTSEARATAYGLLLENQQTPCYSQRAFKHPASEFFVNIGLASIGRCALPALV
jgi:hypothetical protein